MPKGSEDSSNPSAQSRAQKQNEIIDLTGLTLNELRNTRRRLENDEQELSFVRRVLHGRIDILSAEIRRRAGDGDEVLPHLREILSDGPSQARPAGGGRRNVDVDGAVQANEIAVAADHADRAIASLNPAALTDEQLVAAIEDLKAHEVAVSKARAQTHERLDRMGSELTRRYREGSAQVDDLLAAARRK